MQHSDVAEVRLFRAVVWQAFEDAAQTPRDPASNNRHNLNHARKHNRYVAEARAWLLNDNERNRIASLADMDEGMVSDRAKAMAHNGWRLN